MLATRGVTRVLQNRAALVQSSRNMSVISSPPQVRISFPEKLCHGAAIISGCLAIPVWVLLHIRDYKNKS